MQNSLLNCPRALSSPAIADESRSRVIQTFKPRRNSPAVQTGLHKELVLYVLVQKAPASTPCRLQARLLKQPLNELAFVCASTAQHEAPPPSNPAITASNSLQTVETGIRPKSCSAERWTARMQLSPCFHVLSRRKSRPAKRNRTEAPSPPIRFQQLLYGIPYNIPWKQGFDQSGRVRYLVGTWKPAQTDASKAQSNQLLTASNSLPLLMKLSHTSSAKPLLIVAPF